MNKLIKMFLLCLVFIPAFFTAVAQNRYFTKDAKINFNSSTPLEDIVANTNQATSFIDTDKNEVVISVLTSSFIFRRALMQEHFNENFMESAKYPKAKFTGKIITPVDWKSEKTVIADVKGDLTIHGTTKEITVKATITPGQGKIVAGTEFTVTPEEFKIIIPAVVRDKIAKEVKIKMDAVYTPYQQ